MATRDVNVCTVKGTEQTLCPGAPRQRQWGQRRECAEHGPYPLDPPKTEWGKPLCKEAAGIRLNPGTCLSPLPTPQSQQCFLCNSYRLGEILTTESHLCLGKHQPGPLKPLLPAWGPGRGHVAARLPKAGEGTWQPAASWEPAAAEQR